MRASVVRLTVGLALLGALVAGCGDGSDVAADPVASDSPTASSAPTSTAPTPTAPTPSESAIGAAGTPASGPVGARKTCVELYGAPDQLMQHAIAFVHGPPSSDEVAQARDLVDALATAAGHALKPLADHITVVRVSVDDKRASAQSGGSGRGPDMRAFDAAGRQLANDCELYND